MTAAEFEAAGLYDPSAPNAAERLAVLEWLAERGVPLEAMQQANAHGQLAFAASIRAMRAAPHLTQDDLAALVGVSPELLDQFRLAFALPPLPRDAPWCNEEEARLFRVVSAGVELFGSAGMLRLCRVIGSSVATIAEAMATTNHERLRRIFGEGATELEIAKANLMAVETSGAPAQIVQALLPLHLQIASGRLRSRRSSIEQPTVRGCVGFVDLVGSTTLARRLSADQLAAIVDRFEEVAYEVATNRRGRVVKFIGDEVMFVTGDAASACDIALTLIERFRDDEAVTPRGGVAMGEILVRAGDYYGPVVNLAARLAELAVPREVLASEELASELASSNGNFVTESAGRRMLRGFDEPVALRSVRHS